MRIFITGGNGLVGNAVTSLLLQQGHEVTHMQRQAGPDGFHDGKVHTILADGTGSGPWQDEMISHDVVINLAGATIFTRWNEKNKSLIYKSRILTTRNIVQALERKGNRVKRFISTSAVGYYGPHGDEFLDEEELPGNDFLAVVTRDWEGEARQAERSGVSTAITRFGIVLSEKGGALGQLIPLFRRGLGSPLGTGRQWFSWIHHEDLARIILFLIDSTRIQGPVNCTAPVPVTNRELTTVLARVLGRPAFLPAVPSFALKLALGEFASVLLGGQRAVPARLLGEGFSFSHGSLAEALEDILKAR